jgi:hypothetical protein
MAIEQINSGAAPIVWSTVDEAFRIVNQNFTTLVATIGDYGVTPIDFNTLSTNVSPGTSGAYDLGASSFKWRDLYLSSTLHIGSASITSSGSIVQLPAGSTIGGLLLDESYFKTIAVSGQDSIVADTGTDTLTVAGGAGITVSTTATTDTLTITNTGVTQLIGTVGQIGVSGSTGSITLSNLGVTKATAGAGISISSSTGDITISNAGIISIVTDPGSGISLDTSVPNTVRITNSAPNITQNTFRNINVAGQDPVIAETGTDTLTLVAGTGITLTTNAAADSVTISNNSSSAYQLVNGDYTLLLAVDGSLELGNGFTVNHSTSTGVNCPVSVDTVVYTSVDADARTIKLLAQFEGPEDGGDGNYHTQSCDIIVVKRTGPLGTVLVDATVYGGIYTSTGSLVTFDAQWNAISERIEVTARPVSLTNDGWVKVYATEVNFGGPA